MGGFVCLVWVFGFTVKLWGLILVSIAGGWFSSFGISGFLVCSVCVDFGWF